jgi:peptidoglycan/LPS O-acetylase OafA/YrhL
MVICCHSAGAYVSTQGTSNLYEALPFVRGGWLGVDLFFVLSGYLIGKQLWRELQKTGTIRFTRFVLRRGLRIWPLYFAMIGVCLLLRISQGREIGHWWSDAFCVSNYVGGAYVPGGWSLSTEEQFYLLAPLFILLLGTYWSKLLTRYRWPLLACLAALPILRWLTYAGPAGLRCLVLQLV